MKKIIQIIITVCLCFIGFCAFIFIAQDGMIFHHVHDPVSRSRLKELPEFHEVEFIGTNGKTYHGMLRKDGDQVRPLILYFGGNGEVSYSHMWFREQMGHWDLFEGFHYLFVDYDGYGLNSGRTHYRNMYEGALEIFDYASSLSFVDTKKIVVMGFSIGTGSAVYLSANRPVQATILISPYANGFDLFNNVLPIFHGPLRHLVRQRIPSDLYARKITTPTLVIASQADRIVPYSSSVQLSHELAGEVTMVTLERASHNDVLTDRNTNQNIHWFLMNLRASDRI